MYNFEILKWLGVEWKLLLDVEKCFYVDEVKRLWVVYMKDYFDYKYRLWWKSKILFKKDNKYILLMLGV